jgi:hypothetical protein
MESGRATYVDRLKIGGLRNFKLGWAAAAGSDKSESTGKELDDGTWDDKNIWGIHIFF